MISKTMQRYLNLHRRGRRKGVFVHLPAPTDNPLEPVIIWPGPQGGNQGRLSEERVLCPGCRKKIQGD